MTNANTAHTAVLFPGQGSQSAGMRDLVERHRPDLLELAPAIVGADPFERAGDGTRWAQPAIFCAALAGWERLAQAARPAFMAGHSLGEIAALVAAQALSAEDGLRLVAGRGRLMQEAAERADGGMLAVRAGGRRDAVAAVAAAAGVCIANDNSPDQLVLSGAGGALDEAAASLAEGGMRSKRLPVAGAFHSPLMAPAVAPFAELVATVRFAEPLLPVLSCVTAAVFDDVPRRLVEAITSPVRWLEVMRALERLGAAHYVETGPGRVLTGLVRKTIVGARAQAPLAMEHGGA